MVRDDARTVSFTSVIVSSSKQEMNYRSVDLDFQGSQTCFRSMMAEQGIFK
jgi:hypothetical protein